jgi:hypothetical protein
MLNLNCPEGIHCQLKFSDFMPELISCKIMMIDLFFSLMKRTKNQGLWKKKLKISLSGENEISSSIGIKPGYSATYQLKI